MKAILCDTLNRQVLAVVSADDPIVNTVYTQPNRSVILISDDVPMTLSEAQSSIRYEYSTYTDTYIAKFIQPRTPPVATIPVTTISSNTAPTSEEDPFL